MTTRAGSSPKSRKTAGSTERLITAVVDGHSVKHAAKLAKMSEETAHRRLREPDVIAQLAELRASLITTAADRLAALALGSVIAIAEMARDTNMPPSVRFRAHREIVARAFEAHDVRILGERLATVERALEAERAVREQARLHAVPGGAR